MRRAFDYVEVDEPDPITERYPSSPPVSAIRMVVSHDHPTLHSTRDIVPHARKMNLVRLSAVAVIVALTITSPLVSVLYLVATLALLFLARKQ